ncbi:alpha/beta hydrolase family protein [Paenibacillus whitsoniae]|uniref:Dipeptidyl aminopeptidase n=1 Tax=Paenibacillus whitsoniae TaxID=2496558 RepID=A0A3S0BPH8_9BACL|nr:acetylxylan esterase [Paenibacillus whitsoniae]RTE11251.1 dipeptidyl aminopeptidase [Paenibacillus whitsoniae]
MTNRNYNRTRELPWDFTLLAQEPRIYPVPELSLGGVQAMYYEGLPYQGKTTRVFAYYALPVTSEDEKVPGIVLVHGGGGTAFKEWVQLWADKGYAAIAMDLEGHLPTEKTSDGQWPRHRWGGPSREGVFADYALPLEDQWMYHAIANVTLAHSVLRSFPHVNPDAVGVHGISWGGIVTSAIAGLDRRLAFAIPVYGCGYLYEASNQYGQAFATMPLNTAEQLKQLWDPSAYFKQADLPMLWVNWSHDPHFPLHLFSKSYEASRHSEHSVLSVQFNLGHSHSAGWKPLEIYRFADQIARAGQPLPRIEVIERTGNQISVSVVSELPLERAELRYAEDVTDWFQVEWLVQDVQLAGQRLQAEIPLQAVAFFIQVTDAAGSLISTPIQLTDAVQSSCSGEEMGR